jgi:hypothetical protein
VTPNKKLKPNPETKPKIAQAPPLPIITSNPMGAVEQSRISQLKKIEAGWRKYMTSYAPNLPLLKEIEQLKNGKFLPDALIIAFSRCESFTNSSRNTSLLSATIQNLRKGKR